MPKYESRARRLGKALEELLQAVSAAQEALSEVECLRDEIDEWKSSLEGTNFENTEKYGQLEQTYDALDDGHDTIETALGEVESAVEELANIDFPGMY